MNDTAKVRRVLVTNDDGIDAPHIRDFLLVVDVTPREIQ